MFPDNTLRDEIKNFQDSLEAKKRSLGKTPSIDFEKSKIIMANGGPKLVTDIEAIQQWIILFVTTPRDVYEIYKGTNFGTSYRKLLGEKFINNGYAESELEREIIEGLPLNPAIEEVRSVEISKEGKYLSLLIQVELYDGSLLDTFVDKAYTVK